MDELPYKILFIAYACEPGRGSEWGLGWSYVDEMARTQPVWVLVHEDCRAALDAYLATKHKGFPVYVTYVCLPGWLGWMRHSFYTLFNIHYYLWQFAAARALRLIHGQVRLDLVQHVSLFRWWMPSAGSALVDDGVGFIFGPVGGGEVLPKNFRNGSPLYGKLSDLLRLIGRSIWRRDPLLKRCVHKAHLLVAGIPACAEWFGKYGNPNIEIVTSATTMSQTVCDAARQARAERSPGQPFTFASCGGLSYYRGVDLALRAFAKANMPGARYAHACDGPMRPVLEKLALDLGIADRVDFLGDIPHIDCVRAVARADACVHTVLRDSQGVLCEAMQAGVPVITLDHLTPAMLVTPESGYLIPMNDNTRPEDIIDELADVMKQWYDDPTLLARKGQAAIERAQSFSPAAKGQEYRRLHRKVLEMLRNKSSTSTVAVHHPNPRTA